MLKVKVNRNVDFQGHVAIALLFPKVKGNHGAHTLDRGLRSSQVNLCLTIFITTLIYKNNDGTSVLLFLCRPKTVLKCDNMNLI